jgi:HSP20 family protein
VVQPSFTAVSESRELAEDIRALFDELASTLSHEQRAYSGECHPVLDVYETEDSVQILVDVSGVPAEAIRIVFRDGVVVIAGEKAPSPTSSGHTFHLVEREFGRFARAVRVNGAFDLTRAGAILQDGELRIDLPKMADRRGQAHRIAVNSADRPA